MEFTDKDIVQLENFWKGNISEADRLALENRFETDLEFRKKAGELKLFTEGLKVLKEREMRKHIKDINTKLPPFDPPSSTNWLKIGIVALAIALAAFAVWFFTIREEVQPLSPMVAAYFEPFEPLGFKMGEDSNQRLKEALSMYAEKKYDKAIPLLQNSFIETKDSMPLFYKAVSLLAVGKSSEGQSVFEQMQYSSSYPIFRDASQWYLALTYVDTQQNEKAANILRGITKGGYKSKADDLLKKL